MSAPGERHGCGGNVELTTTTFYRERGEHRWLFERVPSYVCERCGTRDFPYEVVEAMDRIIADGTPPTRTVEVGVYDLAELPKLIAAKPRAAT